MTGVRERALELLERHITNGRQHGDDPAVTALECLLALEGIGYRPTAARPAAEWKLHAAGSGPSEETRALMEQAKQRADEATARTREREVS